MIYRSVILGGTFDRLHFGHEVLLQTALTIGETVTIGLTTDEYVRTRKKTHVNILSYDIRKNMLLDWLSKKGGIERVQIVPIDDPIGPAADERYSFDAIVVSENTRIGADRINTKRNQAGLPKLAIITVPVVSATDVLPISSGRIREGKIDRNGNLMMPVSLREILGKPIGVVLDLEKIAIQVKKDAKTTMISIGDKATEHIIKMGVKPTLAVIDLLVERKPFHWDKTIFDMLTHDARVVLLTSGPGHISKEAIIAVKHFFSNETIKQSNSVCVVDGEEDLLVLPVLLYAPMGAVIYYGQPKEGLVRVLVTKQKKEQAQALLSQFV